MKAYAVSGTAKLESLLEKMAEFENLSRKNEPEYIIFDEQDFADRLCECKAGSDPEYCPEECTCNCWYVDSLVESAFHIVSAGNRVIDALIRKRYSNELP